MKRIFLIVLFAVTLITSLVASDLKIAYLGDFILESGDTLKNLQVGYRTFGELNSTETNAILYPTWFGGTSEHLSHLLGNEKLIDTTNYFIICIDALGNGISSSPSNSQLQPGKNFPQITIRDMVDSQYKVLTQVLKIDHLYAILGGSMGGMQVFQWLVSYPDFMDKAIAYVGTPKPSFFDLLIFETYLQIIDSGKRAKMPDNEILKNLRMTQALIGRTPDFFVQKMSPIKFQKFLDDVVNVNKTTFTADNWRLQTIAMLNHDITKNFDNDWHKTAAAIKADVLIIVSKTDHYINPAPALNLAKLINAKTVVLNSNCGHLAVGCQLKFCREKIAEFLKQ